MEPRRKENNMEWLGIVTAILPSFLRVVEGFFSKKPKSGAEKKEAAMGGLAGFAKGMETVSTGGQKETWRAINENMPIISELIDQTVTTMNDVGLFDSPFDEDHAS